VTKLLLRLFVKNYAQAEVPQVRSAIGRLSGVVGIVCNVVLFALKLAVGILSGSVSITADAMNNLSDATSSVVTLVGFKLAEKPADSDHPYGHARYEYLSGLAVAALIVVIGVELLKTSVQKIFAPVAVDLSIPVVVVLVGSIAVKLWLALFNGKLGKHIGSTALEATGADSRNDVIATSAVLLAALVEGFTGWKIDGFMGLAVALFILYSGVTMAKQTISPLLGEAASPELRKLIIQVVGSDPRVLGYHDLMVHDYGPGQQFATVHVEMDCREDPLFCHELIDDMERECLRNHGIHLVIHYDPVDTGDPELMKCRRRVTEILKEYDPRLTLHDFRMIRGGKNTNLIFDVALPADLRDREGEIRSLLSTRLNEEPGMYYHLVLTFDLEESA